MTIKRSIFLGLALLLSSSFAVAKTGEFKVATIAPEGTSWMTQMRAAAEAIKTQTSGRVNFKFYPGGVMGNDKTLMRKIKLGQLQGAAFTAGALAEIDPAPGVYSLPMLFRSIDEVHQVRAYLDEQIRQRLVQKGLRVLGVSEGGFAYVMSAQAITGLDDFRHRKLWIPEGDEITANTFLKAGLQPVPLPLADVYTGLQTGLIDSVIASTTGAIAFQWHTKIKYMVDFPLAYLSGFFVLDEKAFSLLSSADQIIVQQSIHQAFVELDAINQRDNVSARSALGAQGIQINPLSDMEMQTWRRIASDAMQELQRNSGFPREIYQHVLDLLTAYRNKTP